MSYYSRQSKYNNRKVEFDGITFDSAREAQRYQELKWMQQAGVISELKLQVPYELIPAAFEESTELYSRGPKKGQPKPGRCIEQACTYLADFQYYENGKLVVEDAKGMHTKEYVIKRKLMLFRHGIRIREV